MKCYNARPMLHRFYSDYTHKTAPELCNLFAQQEHFSGIL